MKKQILAILFLICLHYGQGRACQNTLVEDQPNMCYSTVQGLPVSYYDTGIWGYMPLQAEKTFRDNMPVLLDYLDQTTSFAKNPSIREFVDTSEGSQEDRYLTALMLSHVDFHQLITQFMGQLSNLGMSLEANKNRLALTKNSPEAVERALAELSSEPFEKILLQAQQSFATNPAAYFIGHPESISARLGSCDAWIQRLNGLAKMFDHCNACESKLRAIFAEYIAKKTRLDILNNVLYHTEVMLHGAPLGRAENRKKDYDTIVNSAEAEHGDNLYFIMAHQFSFNAQTPQAQALLPRVYEACANSSVNTLSRYTGNALATTLKSLSDEQNVCEESLDKYRLMMQSDVPEIMNKLEQIRLAASSIQRKIPDLAHNIIAFQESMHYFSQASPLEAFRAIVEAAKEIITGARFVLKPGSVEECTTYKADYEHYALIAERTQLLIKGLQAQWQTAVTK